MWINPVLMQRRQCEDSCRLAAILGALTIQKEELAHEGFDFVGWDCLLGDIWNGSSRRLSFLCLLSENAGLAAERGVSVMKQQLSDAILSRVVQTLVPLCAFLTTPVCSLLLRHLLNHSRWFISALEAGWTTGGWQRNHSTRSSYSCIEDIPRVNTDFV